MRSGASAAGLNSSEGPTTWDGSAAGFEQRALGHRDSIVLFDDMSHLSQPELAKLVTFRLASNRPKTKAGQYVSANNIVELNWRVISGVYLVQKRGVSSISEFSSPPNSIRQCAIPRSKATNHLAP